MPPEGNSTTPNSPFLIFLSPEDLAGMFKVPVETVYQWRRKRTGPPGFRAGRHVRYNLATVLAWAESQTSITA